MRVHRATLTVLLAVAWFLQRHCCKKLAARPQSRKQLPLTCCSLTWRIADSVISGLLCGALMPSYLVVMMIVEASSCCRRLQHRSFNLLTSAAALLVQVLRQVHSAAAF